MGDIESQIRNLVQQLGALGIVGPQAEAVARSLIALRNASDAVTSASLQESEAKRIARERTDRFSSNMRDTANHLHEFATSVISTADSMAGSNTVFTQISPMITFAGESIKKLGSFGDEIGSAIGAGLGALVGGAGATIGAKFGEMLGGLIGNTLGNLAEIGAKIFNQYLQQGEKVIQAFNNLSSVGVTFGGSLTNMNRIIAKTNLPLEMLATIAKNNAENLALLGGGVEGALERVANAARNRLGPQLVTLYGGFVNLSDELSDYMAMEQRRGVSEDLLSDQNIESTKAYLYQLKEISALTGKSSKQIKSEIEARSRNAATQAMVNKMSAQEKANYDRLMQSIPEGARDALHDLILAQSRGMEPVSRAFLELQSTAPGLTDAMRIAVGDLKKSPADFAVTMGKTSKDLATEAGKLTDEMGDILYLRQAGRLSASVITTLDTALTDLNANRQRLITAGDDIKLFAEQTKALAANSSAFTTSVANVYGAQANLAVKLNQLVLGDEKTEGKFTAFANVATSATNAMEDFVGKLDSVVSYLAGFSKKSPEEQLQAQIKSTQERLEPYYKTDETGQKVPIAPGGTMAFRRQHLENQLKRDEEELRNLQAQKQKKENKGEASEATKSQNKSGETKKDSSTHSEDNPIPVVTPKQSKLDVDFAPLAEMLKTTLDNQSVAIAELANAMRDSGLQIKRTVDRIST